MTYDVVTSEVSCETAMTIMARYLGGDWDSEFTTTAAGVRVGDATCFVGRMGTPPVCEASEGSIEARPAVAVADEPNSDDESSVDSIDESDRQRQTELALREILRRRQEILPEERLPNGCPPAAPYPVRVVPGNCSNTPPDP